MDRSAVQPGEPYCTNCGYSLTGATETSRCPECGRPLVEVLARRGDVAFRGRRFRSQATLFGLPVIHVAIGPSGDQRRGKARGIIAIGDDAFGVLALGGVARGGVAIGGVAVGVASLGGVSVGLLSALGGLSIGGAAVGGMAVGALASGGVAAGIIADGAIASGYYARGVVARGAHTAPLRSGPSSTQAAEMFRRTEWFFGRYGTGLPRPTAALNLAMFDGVLALAVAVIAFLAVRAHGRRAGGHGARP